MLNRLIRSYYAYNSCVRGLPIVFMLSLLLMQLFVVDVSAQGTLLTGQVLDATTHEGLGYVGVYIQGTNNGTVADSAGFFSVVLPATGTFLEVSVIGYERKLIKLTPAITGFLRVELKPSSLQLQEVIVKQGKKKGKRVTDTAALYVLAQVLDHKDENNPETIPSYYTHEHSKLVTSLIQAPAKFANRKVLGPYSFFLEKRDTNMQGEEFIPLAILEEYNETYHRAKPLLDRKVVHYRHLSGFKKEFIANYLSDQFNSVDIYKNVYIIANKPFTSPFSPQSRATYIYHILDTIRSGDGVSYKLNFVAKNKEDVALKGYAIIDSATWGISTIYFKPNERANINFLTDYSVEQQFRNTGKGWVMLYEKLAMCGNLLEQKEKMSFYVTKVTLRDSIQFSHSIPDSVRYATGDIIPKDAYKKRRSYLDTLRIAPLNEAEEHIYHSFDTAVTLKSFKKLQWLGNFITTGTLRAGPIDFGPVYYAVSRNATEGYRIRMGAYTNEKFSRVIYLYGHAAYGFTDKKWKYQADVHIKLPTQNNLWHTLSLHSRNDMMVLGNNNAALAYDNVLTLLTPANKLNKMMHLATNSAEYEKEWFKGFTTNIGLSFNQYYSTPRGFEFWDRQHDTHIENFRTTELSAEFRYRVGDRYTEKYGQRHFVTTSKPAFTFKYTWGIKNRYTGDYAYHKLEYGVSKLIYMPIVGYGKFTANAGYIFGNAPYPLAFISGANQSIFRDETAYQLTQQNEFAHDRFVSLWYEHHFQGLLFNHIPYVNKAKLREFVTVKALWGDMKASSKSILSQPYGMHTTSKGPYVEVGVGIENILKVIQVSCTWRTNYRNMAGAENFAVKIAIKPSF